MVDAQNERTTSQKRRRGRRRKRGRRPEEVETAQRIHKPEPEPNVTPVPEQKPVVVATPDAHVMRPADITPPTVRSEEYCIRHMASFSDGEPMETRTNMTTLRHLRVDHFGEATLFCDCLHNGPHEWPPSMQKIETAVELDQFLADSTNEA